MDIRFEEEQLAACGYDELIEMNLEDSSRALPRRYDVMVLLHVLEHLHSPELILPDLVAHVVQGGILVGGFPSHPDWSVRLRERRLGRKAKKFGHVTAFSPKRVRDLARQNGLHLEFLSGAFLMRSKGFLLENFAWWLRANLLFGALFPSWPGEIYWLMRKPIKA